MAQEICELLWLSIGLENLKIRWDESELYCDNKSTISMTNNPVQHDRTKHNEVESDFVKENLNNGLICTSYVSTQSQLANILTDENQPRNIRLRRLEVEKGAQKTGKINCCLLFHFSLFL